MKQHGRSRWIWLSTLVAAALVVVAIWGFAGSTPATGDPGGEVMRQLTPATTSLPGYGTPALHWVSQIPQNHGASYMIKMEPTQDSCDGVASTMGWSQVVVQAGFQWNNGLPALVAYMDPRLGKLGWSAVRPSDPASPPTGEWIKTLSNRTRAQLSISEEGPPVWEFVAIAAPIGKAGSGC